MFSLLAEIPIDCYYALPKPLKHPLISNCIIMSTDYEERQITPGIYQYNVESNKCSLIYKYNNECTPECHGQYMDPVNNLLYLFGRRNVLNAFDLKTNTMQKINNCHPFAEACTNWPASTYIPFPVNQAHILLDDKHYKYDIKHKTMIQLKGNSALNGIVYAHLLYIPIKKQLMFLGSSFDSKILSCDIQQNSDQTEYEWKMCKLKMPRAAEHCTYDTLLGFDNILFVFYFVEKDIYLLDLLNNKWFKSKYSLPNFGGGNNTYIFVVQNNYSAHFIYFYNKIHYKVCLFDLIPKEIVISHRKYYNGLIMGYLREQLSK
eukprot:136213_1